jgi:hypothetical protein
MTFEMETYKVNDISNQLEKLYIIIVEIQNSNKIKNIIIICLLVALILTLCFLIFS